MANHYDGPTPYAKCMRCLRGRNGRPRPCRNRRCPSWKCRAGYAEKEAAILERSFRTKPPDFIFVLGFADGESTNDRMMAAYLNAFNQKVKDRRKSDGITLEYDGRIEFGRDSNPHCHLTIITSAKWSVVEVRSLANMESARMEAQSFIRALWMASCPNRKVHVYGDWVHNAEGHANYVCKNVIDRSGVRGPPPDWNGKTCRFVRTSRGFLSATKKTLWKERYEEWYAPKKAAEVVDNTPTPPCPPEKVSGHAAIWKKYFLDPPRRDSDGRNRAR